jgi:hypothetical protein
MRSCNTSDDSPVQVGPCGVQVVVDAGAEDKDEEEDEDKDEDEDEEAISIEK